MAGKKEIQLTLTEKEAKAVVAGLKACFDFGVDYFMFAPGRDGYSDGDFDEDQKLQGLAIGVVDRIEKQLPGYVPMQEDK